MLGGELKVLRFTKCGQQETPYQEGYHGNETLVLVSQMLGKKVGTSLV
jgi:hypothetical protein